MYVNTEKKPLPPPEKKHTKELLQEVSIRKLRKFCQKYNLPYYHLKKLQIIENIHSWERGKGIVYHELLKTWEETKQRKHLISSRMRRFCFEYSSGLYRFTQEGWGKRFGVAGQTVARWLQWREVQNLIETFIVSHEGRIKEKFEQNEEEIIEEMIRLIKKSKFGDVKRKAIVDFLGFAGRRNINAGRVELKQQQLQGQVAVVEGIAGMAEEDIEKELKEIEDLGE